LTATLSITGPHGPVLIATNASDTEPGSPATVTDFAFQPIDARVWPVVLKVGLETSAPFQYTPTCFVTGAQSGHCCARCKAIPATSCRANLPRHWERSGIGRQ